MLLRTFCFLARVLITFVAPAPSNNKIPQLISSLVFRMTSVKDYLGLDDKYGKVIGSLLGEGIVLSERTRGSEQELTASLAEADRGARLVLLESIISSGVDLSAVGAPGELVLKWLSADAAIYRRVEDWTSNEILEKSIHYCLEENAEVVDVHYTSLERILTELTESVANSLEGTGFRFQSLRPFGSSVSHLCVAGSCDIDVVLCVASQVDVYSTGQAAILDVPVDNREESCEVLALAQAGLMKGTTFEIKELVTRARVPVLKLRHLELGTEVRKYSFVFAVAPYYTCAYYCRCFFFVQIDLVVNRTNGLENTALLVRYLSLDDRVRPLVIAIKQWAKCRGICNARNSTLSSYGWTLLALHFLQHTLPPVLPKALGIHTEDPPVTAAVMNTDTVGTLLLKFFAYYGLPHASLPAENLPSDTKQCFNLFHQVVTLDGDCSRVKSKTTNSPVTVTEDVPAGEAAGLPAAPWWRFSIQDPLDAGFDVGRVIHSYEGQVLILNELRRALSSLLKLHPSNAGDGVDGELSYGEKNYPYETLCTLNENVPDLAMKCHMCGGSDHLSAECPEARCEQCHSRDHTTRHCPNKICYHCRGYHLKSQCPLLRANSDATASGGIRATSVIPRALLERHLDDEMEPDDDTGGTQDRSRVRRRCNGDGFMEEILRWQVGDFTNQKLYHGELRRIPLEFESSTAWYRTFFPFLLEEMRSQVQKVADGSFYMIPRSAVKFSNPNINRPDEMSILPTIPAYMILATGLDETKYEDACTCTVGLLVSTAKNANRELTSDALAKTPHLLVRIEFRVKADGYNVNEHELNLLREHPGCMIFNIEVPNCPIALDLLNSSSTRSTPQWELLAIGVGTYSSIRTCDALARQDSPPLIMDDVVTGQNVCAAVSGTDQALRGTHTLDVSDEFTVSLNESQQNAVRQVLEVGSPLGISTLQIIKGPPGLTISLTFLLHTLLMIIYHRFSLV